MANRGIPRGMFKNGLRVPRLIIHGGGSVQTPFHIAPQAEPTVTAVKGDLYFDSTTNTLKVHNGTAFANASNKYRTVKTAAATLTAEESGALCLWNAAAGFTYTLPAPQVGLTFDFLVTVSVTSVAAKVITNAGTVFLVGGFLQHPDAAADVSVVRAANGTTHVAWSGNGTTTGGLIGDTVSVTCISATQWAVSGYGTATGAEATPFATS